MSIRSRTGLLRYWSIRYFIALILCIAFTGFAAYYTIQLDAERAQRASMLQLARTLAEQAAERGGVLADSANLAAILEDRAHEHNLTDRPIMFIYDLHGVVVQQFPPQPPAEATLLAARLDTILSEHPHAFELPAVPGRPAHVAAVQPILAQDTTAGYMLYMAPKVDVLLTIQFRRLRLAMVITLLISGWIIIYMITRRLVKPVRELADAAKQIVAGNYDVQLNKDYREKEIYELVDAFKEMAERLDRLEAKRAERLAGVTHELKTPVTSISGFVQAVKDGVVSGKEAEAFLAMCVQECRRLEKMVDDLLDYNSTATHPIAIVRQPFDLQSEVGAMLERWKQGQGLERIQLTYETMKQTGGYRLETDAARLEQIVVNVLNNARAAMPPDGKIRIRLETERESFHIHIEDTGRGIPPEEQAYIFEPLYRGKEKKSRVRGLGLGLSFSRMVARALGGDLVLADSSPLGTTFTLVVPAIGSAHADSADGSESGETKETS